MKINKIQGVIFDLDGTVYLGEEALPGAVETLAELRRQGKRLLFVSNKPLEPRLTYARKLSRMGIPAKEGDVITSAGVLGSYLSNHVSHLHFYIVGEENLKEELRQHGLQLVDELSDQDPYKVIDPLGVEAVVVAFDRTLDYRKLNTAYQALRQGARYFATNGDAVCPMPGGAIPDAGATLQYLEHLTARRPEVVAGKPSPLILQVALDRLDLQPQECLLVGDRLETDIRMAKEAGMWAAVVLTGVTHLEDVPRAHYPPDLVLETLADLLKYV
jgi:arabinose operon protein AraL